MLPKRNHPPRHLRRLPRVAVLALLAGLGPEPAARACTTMSLGPAGARNVAYSYDQSDTGAGLILFNPPGAIRQSFATPAPAEWTARHGSISLNQFGPGFPTAGMNTAGLVVTLMWNDAARYAGPGPEPAVQELEFIQYLLDTAATVDEALDRTQGLRVTGFIPIHYFLQDRAGNTAVLRPDGDAVEVVTGADMPVPALTNMSYGALLDGLSRFRPFGGAEALQPVSEISDPDLNSLVRFGQAAVAIDAQSGGTDPAGAFAALESVRTADTRWQVLFDPQAGSVVHRTAADGTAIRHDLYGADLSCRSVPLAAPLDGGPARRLDQATLEPLLAEAFGSFDAFAAFGPGFAAEVAAAQLAPMRCAP